MARRTRRHRCTRPRRLRILRGAGLRIRRDAADPSSAHDFGNNIIPYLVRHGKAKAPPIIRFMITACAMLSRPSEFSLLIAASA